MCFLTDTTKTNDLSHWQKIKKEKKNVTLGKCCFAQTPQKQKNDLSHWLEDWNNCWLKTRSIEIIELINNYFNIGTKITQHLDFYFAYVRDHNKKDRKKNLYTLKTFFTYTTNRFAHSLEDWNTNNCWLKTR